MAIKEKLDEIWNNAKLRDPDRPAVWTTALVRWFGGKEK